MSSMYLAVSSCICCRYSMVRTHEGSGLTIRIPRQLSDRGATHSAAHHPLVSPEAQHRAAHVTKSKSLTTSMDKLTSAQGGGGGGQQQQEGGAGGGAGGGGGWSSRPCSRGSTPSSTRSARRPPHPPPRSPRTPDPDTPDADERCAKTNSPCGSEVSLHSVKSAASAKSSLSAKSSASTRSNLSARSSASAKSNGSAKSDSSAKSKEAAKPLLRKSPSLSSRQSLKSATPKSTKAKSPVPTHGGGAGTSTSSTPPAHTPSRRRSTASNASSASSAETAQQTGMANGEQHTSSSSSRRTTPPRQTPPRTYGSGTPSGATTPRHMLPKKPLPVFNSYMSLFQVQEKLKKGEVIEGVLRINPKNYEDAYISAPVILGRGDGHLYWRGT